MTLACQMEEHDDGDVEKKILKPNAKSNAKLPNDRGSPLKVTVGCNGR